MDYESPEVFFTMHPYIKDLYKELNKKRDPEVAVPMKKYMRNQFEFFGIKSEERRLLCKDYMNSKPLPTGGELRAIVSELWTLPERDFQYFAIELLMKCKKQWNEQDIVLFEQLIVNKSWWDSVDYLANHVTGPWFRKYPKHIKKITGRWNKSDNIWLQRMSLLFQLKYKKETDLSLLFRYIKNLSESREFFVQKAIGWILREYSKTDPEAVLGFLKENELKPLSRREAMKVIERNGL